MLTCMNVCMFLHITLLMETFAAITAREWSGIAVYEQMSGQGAGSFKTFATLFAFKDFFNIVDSPKQMTNSNNNGKKRNTTTTIVISWKLENKKRILVNQIGLPSLQLQHLFFCII